MLYLKHIFAWLIMLCLTANTWALQSEAASGFADEPSLVLHVDVNRSLESSSGQLIWEAVTNSSFVKNQLAAIPADLQFLKTAKLDEATLKNVAGGRSNVACRPAETGFRT